MDKLIELLNQFEKEKKSWYTWRSIDSYDNCVYGVDSDWETEITMYSDLYSKYYWFIEWLFREWKLDMNKIYNTPNLPRYEYKNWDAILYTFPDELIMLLSIQDNPIEFLCSVLK